MSPENPNEWKQKIEGEIARENARERTIQCLQRLQEAAQVARENPNDAQKLENLKKEVVYARGFRKTDVNLRFADNMHLLTEELRRVEQEFGLAE